ncbi:MAG: beta strand repeat-containing protein, partial [Thermomicrobiales bacterium]
DINLDLKARLRSETAVTEFTATIDSLTAGGTINLLLQDSVQETGAGDSSGIRVTTLSENDFPITKTPGVKDKNYTNYFRDDKSGTTKFNIGAFGGNNISPKDSLYDFRNLDGSGNRTVAGLIAGNTNGNIIIKDVQGAADDTINGMAGLNEPTIDVVGLSNLLGTGHIDVNVDGMVTLAETTGDLRVGLIRSRGDDVTLTSLDGSIVDAPTGAIDGAPTGDSTPDVVGINLTLLAPMGGIGSTSNFLEIDSSNRDGKAEKGLVDGQALNGIYLTEISGDLRLKLIDSDQGDVSLVTLAGSIIDGRPGAGTITDVAVVLANSIDMQAIGGSIGEVNTGGGDIEIDSSRQSTGDVGLEATNYIYVTEVAGTLRLVQARTPIDPDLLGGGDIHLTVRESTVATSLNENLDLLATGDVLFVEYAPRTVSNGFIRAGGRVELRIGDDLFDHVNTTISAGDRIDIYLDDLNNGTTQGDFGYGANTTLVGTLTPGDGKVTSIFGFTDVDRITLDQTTLGGYTRIHGSNLKTAPGATAPVGDGEDIFTINKLQSMTVGTLTLDGQAGSDHYIINTTGSQNADRNYIINALDTGANADGVDVLSIHGFDSSENGIDPTNQGLPYATDDIFLLRGMNAIAGLNGNELTNRPSFVGLLHGTLAQAQSGTSTAVERINYDAAINGRLEVFGQGGNDSFATDDNSAITTLDGGMGDDNFQIGQLYGSQRNTSAHLDPNDLFATVATTRGWLSSGNTSPLLAEGGSGNDQFTVYSNQAVLRLEGGDDNDQFIVRAFAIADTAGGTEGATKTYMDGGVEKIATFHDGIWWRTYNPAEPAQNVALPALISGFSTAQETAIRTGGGQNQVQYNINAPVSIDGGAGFDKVVVLGTEFADHIVITDTAVYGAGLAVTYENVEVLEVDGLEGDDSFDELSTPAGVITRIIGGLGSDIINVGGDVIGTVFAQDVEGSSGAINHLVTSGDVRYNGMVISGIDLSVARPNQGVVIINDGGFTEVTEGAGFTSYTVALQHPSTEDVYITVSAALSLLDEQKMGADSIWVSENSADFYRHFTDNYVAGVQPIDVPKRAIVLHFAPGETAAKTVYVLAPIDGVAEGDRNVVISHSVISKDSAFDNQVVRNVEVKVHDIDQPGINLIAINPDTGLADNQSIVLEGNAPTGITDQYKVHLAIPPAAGQTVVLDITAGDSRIVLSSASGRFSTVTERTATTPGVYRVIFGPADASDVTVTITAVDDYAAQDPRTTVITHAINAGQTTDSRYVDATTGAKPESLYVKVLDNDSAGVVVVPSNGSTLVNASDGSQTDSYTLRLTTAPTDDVKISILTDGQTNIQLGGRVQLAAIGTALNGLYTGIITWDSNTRTLTR